MPVTRKPKEMHRLKNKINRNSTKTSVLRDPNLHIIFSITLFAVMGVASITPAFPQIIKHYKLTVQQIGYLITVFTLPGIFLTPFMGILADKYGRKTILFPSMIIFGIAGIAVGTAFNIWIQGGLLLAYIIYMNSSSVSAMEIGAIYPMIIGGVFFIGVLIGDFSYFVQTGGQDFVELNISNPFVVGD